jgi:hypothetical protein
MGKQNDKMVSWVDNPQTISPGQKLQSNANDERHIVSKLFSTRGYLKTYLTRLISVENTIFLSQFSEHVFIPEQEVGAYIYDLTH